MREVWLQIMVKLSTTILELKKSLLTMGIIRSILALSYILFLEILLALLCLPLYLSQDYLKDPILFNQNGFSYSIYKVRKHVTLSAFVSLLIGVVVYATLILYHITHAPTSGAALNTINFGSASGLEYDPTLIIFSGGSATLATTTGGTVSFADTDNTTSSFGGGTHSNTTWSVASSSIQLSSGQANGLFTSRIIDGGSTSTWQSIAWLPGAPYGKELPDNKAVESAYRSGNMNMSDTIALWHFNETAYTSSTNEVVDSSGNGFHGAGVNVVSTTPIAIFNRALTFNYASSTYVRIVTSSFQSNSQSGTVMAWVRPGATGTGNFRDILSVNDEGGTSQRIVFGLNRDTQIVTLLHQQTGGQVDFMGASSTILTAGTWYHVAWVSNGSSYSIYINGVSQTLTPQFGFGANSGDWFGDVTGADNIIIGARKTGTSASEFYNGQVDELVIIDHAYTQAEVLDAYRRGALAMQLQARTCDDSACSGETFVGPAASTTNYYSELTTSTNSLPSKTLTGLGAGRYFQYRVFASSTDTTMFPTPELLAVTTTASVSSQYVTTSPSIISTVGVPFYTIDGFTETVGAQHTGSVTYQLGLNNTSTWYYWNSTAWTSATSGVAQSNAASVINSHVQTFDNDVGQGTVYVKAFLTSNGSQVVQLTSVLLSTTSTISFTAASSSINESVGTTTLTLALDTISSSTVTVDYSATGGTAASSSDYTLANGTATITAGSTTTSISIPIIDDQSVEGNETIVITLSNAAGALLGTTSTYTYTILDNDVPGITLTESSGSTAVTESGTTDSYTLVLNTQPSSAVTITLTTSTTDISLSTTSINFTASNWNTPVTVTVSAVNDSIAEGTETPTISHTVSSSDGNYSGVSVSAVTVTVTDNDTAGITLTESGGSTAVSESGTTDSYTIVLTSEPTSTVTIDLATSSADITLSTTSIRFTASNWNTPVTVTVSAVDDSIAEGTETPTISHTVSSAANQYAVLTLSNVSVTVTDNDTAAVTVTESGGTTEVNETGPTSDSYTIVLGTQPLATVSITMTTSSGGISLSTSALSFTTSNWSTPQTVTVTAIDDALYEGLHSATITHAASSADGQYNNISVSQVNVDITDNDSSSTTTEENATSTPATPSSTVRTTPSTGSLPPGAFVGPNIPSEHGQSGGGDTVIKQTINVPQAAIRTASRLVTLDIPADKIVKRMAIAYDPTFDRASQEPYAAKKDWDLCAGRPRCRDGLYLVFIRVYSAFGVPSPTITRSYLLETAPPVPVVTVSSTLVEALKKNQVTIVPLTASTVFGRRNAEIIELQYLLRVMGYLPKSQSITGYYGTVTETAVRKYQQAYKLGVTGRVDDSTRQLLNTWLGFK